MPTLAKLRALHTSYGSPNTMPDQFIAPESSNTGAGRPLTARDGEAYLRQLVGLAVAGRVSDLHFKSGAPPYWLRLGEL